MAEKKAFTQWSSLRALGGVEKAPDWVPPDHQERVAAYDKFDELYWNDPRQYALRVLKDEEPIYIPTARKIVDTTSHYLLKNLSIGVDDPKANSVLLGRINDLLEREMFYARFHVAKHAGVARGDFAFHLTADPNKAEGTRISLNSVEPSAVFPTWDTRDRMVACDLLEYFEEKDEKTLMSVGKVRVLHYSLDTQDDGSTRVGRVQNVYQMTGISTPWYKEDAVPLATELNYSLLDPQITRIPVYWFKNVDWEGQTYGSSDLRGIETLIRAISQSTSDTQSALSLEGLGVYYTDGGRPIDDAGVERDWEIAPGVVLELSAGSKFGRVSGISSIQPMSEQIKFLESKSEESAALTDVALGMSDVAVATSGVALQIQFSPTLAKIEERDIAGLARLNQLFYDWVTWHQIFEKEALEGKVVVSLGDKLPVDRVARVNELNNMIDRHVISTAYYRSEMTKLGYVFPDNIEDDIDSDMEKVAALKPAATTDSGADETSVLNENGQPVPADQAGNQSNNKNRVNESSGTEADSLTA